MISFKETYEKMKIEAEGLKKEIFALFLAYRRSDVPWYAKLFTVIVVGYALSPIDLIPDFIPILGYLDDLILIPLGISIAIKLIPDKVIDECRIQAKDLFKDRKPQNHIAAIIIVLIWLLIIFMIISKIFF
ncbi:YkvA family protein [Brassicibacter mesophilus]|uniref:YkvA family protein n=1 Tax=Brassicibacter mesophilus TaxID=745119 RepID=UPI003D1AB25B